ncbi:hypothetical protein WICPIJ_005677 [Wickerhamomyces pijperi]|uniref:FMR1-interacting protein 1 conserved domain-containing protein n=1 Tax=Wickerhamomyces pijperi TaxID=599730 RepID=A0A9P8Q5U4_WICPI|nr:hypothetical protein WICPIJ_005677 [Wickerhamomyces pijperi]
MDYIYGKKRPGSDESNSDTKRMKPLLPGLPTTLSNNRLSPASTLPLPTFLPISLPKPTSDKPEGSKDLPIPKEQLIVSSKETKLAADTLKKDIIVEEQKTDNSDSPSQLPKITPSKPKEIVPISGTNIILKTDDDIQEWIKQRKLNWMKKISNNRPKDETPPPIVQSGNKINNNHNNNKRQTSKKQNKINHNNVTTKQGHSQSRAKPSAPQKKALSTIGPNLNLNNLIIQREMQSENLAILKFIKACFQTGIYQVQNDRGHQGEEEEQQGHEQKEFEQQAKAEEQESLSDPLSNQQV